MRLIEAANNAVIKKGMKALAEESGLAEKTIRQILRGNKVRSTNAYKLALACELGEAEALALAREYLDEAKEAS